MTFTPNPAALHIARQSKSNVMFAEHVATLSHADLTSERNSYARILARLTVNGESYPGELIALQARFLACDEAMDKFMW